MFHGLPIAVDLPHAAFLFGCVMAKKPTDVLELGIGTGYITRMILNALQYNQHGTLTSVDNWQDFQGQEPAHIQPLRQAGARIVAPVTEEEFVRSCASDKYDMLISDADHNRSHLWLDQHLRITRHNGFMFFHDTNTGWAGLQTIEDQIKHMPYFHFKKNTREEELCHRGWLFVVNKKKEDKRPVTIFI